MALPAPAVRDSEVPARWTFGRRAGNWEAMNGAGPQVFLKKRQDSEGNTRARPRHRVMFCSGHLAP